MVLQAVFLWSIQVPALVLGHLDLPLPGDGGDGVYVDGDGDTGGTHGDKHVLPSIIATDDGGWGEPGHSDCGRVLLIDVHCTGCPKKCGLVNVQALFIKVLNNLKKKIYVF